jgi:hypothetical protein
MDSVPRIRLADDDGDWQELEAALSVAYGALTDAQALYEKVGRPDREVAGRGLTFGQALAVVLTILDAYLDPPEAES